ncbi:MAG TPA: L,D-transpeptidase family protein [Puia sp.]|nr:L,D-transpeptidase family protein [Puia sp.]
MKRIVFLLATFAIVFLSGINGCCGQSKSQLPAKQLLIVVTPAWDSVQGELYGFEMVDGTWKRIFQHRSVVGSSGMGIGAGLAAPSMANAPHKKEGDKRSPAGIFTLGSAFGYGPPNQASWIRMPYVRADDTLICVDDSHSSHYNQLTKDDAKVADWKSFERMHRSDEYYKWGLFVNYNWPHSKPGDGSCIFLHIWENDHLGTDGCTAMQESDMLKVLHWLDYRKRPMLVEAPRSYYKLLTKKYHLPEIGS